MPTRVGDTQLSYAVTYTQTCYVFYFSCFFSRNFRSKNIFFFFFFGVCLVNNFHFLRRAHLLDNACGMIKIQNYRVKKKEKNSKHPKTSWSKVENLYSSHTQRTSREHEEKNSPYFLKQFTCHTKRNPKEKKKEPQKNK